MIAQLLGFELKHHTKQAVLWIGVLILGAMSTLLTSQAGSPVDFANSAYSVNRILVMLSMNIIFVVAVLAASSAIRDSQYQMEPLIFASPIDKFQYLTTRFLGIVISACLVFLLCILVMMLTPLFLESKYVAPFDLGYYLYGFFVFILPNIVFCSAVVFAAAMLSKSMLVVYTSAIIIFVLYGVGSILGNSPLMANSSPFLQEGIGMAGLIDPYGAMAFFEQTSFWSTNQRATDLPSLSGNLLFNRLIWITVALSVFALTYRLFSFRDAKQKAAKVEISTALPKTLRPYNTVAKTVDFSRFNWSIFWSKVNIEYRCVVKGKTFIVLMLSVATLVSTEVISNILGGPTSGSPSYYPLTELILELIQDPMTNLGQLMAIFYAVELYWNERTANIHPLVDATATRNLTFYLSKLTTLTAICFTLITVSIATAIVFQLSQGHFDIKPGLYLLLYFYVGLPLMLSGMLTLYMQRFAKGRATGLVAGATVFLIPHLVAVAGLGHPLTVFAYPLDFVFSDMTDSLYHAEAFNWLGLYWASFCAILAVFSVKTLRRGETIGKQPLSTPSRTALAVFSLLFIAVGSYNFYQINIFNHYQSRETRIALRADYERTYAKYKEVQYPTVTDVKVAVDIYPDDNRYTAKGRYIIENQSAQPMQQLLVSVLKKDRLTHEVNIQNAKLEHYDALHHTYQFKLLQPLPPGQSTTLAFSIEAVHNPFTRLDPEHYITEKGSYVELEDVVPHFGYQYRYQLNRPDLREEHGLVVLAQDSPEHHRGHKSADKVFYEATISTVAEQTALTPGILQKSWIEGDRRYFHFKTDQRISAQFAFTSAVYKMAEYQHGDLNIQIYHSPEHDKDNELIFDALSKAVDYHIEHFGPYTFKQFKVIELPYFSSRQSFGTSIPGMFLGVENRFFNLDNRGHEVNPQLRGVTHEFAHQYWGEYLEPLAVDGARMLTETLAKYSEIVVAAHTVSEQDVIDAVSDEVHRYLRMRPFNRGVEPPLYKVTSQANVFYSKGKQAMFALRDLLGEDKVNLALRNVLRDLGYPHKPTSLDLLDAYYAVADSQDIAIIDDLFKRVVFHDLAINSATAKPLDSGEFAVALDITSIKLVMDPDTGIEAQEPINDRLEIAFYDADDNLLQSQKMRFNADQSNVVINSQVKPAYAVIDPKRVRIDRTFQNNRIAVE